MPKFVQKRQFKNTTTCDGDLMTTEKVDKVMTYRGVKVDEQAPCEQSNNCSCCKLLDLLPEDEDKNDFMCGECEEEDSQEVSQDPELEQSAKVEVHPDQLEM